MIITETTNYKLPKQKKERRIIIKIKINSKRATSTFFTLSYTQNRAQKKIEEEEDRVTQNA